MSRRTTYPRPGKGDQTPNGELPKVVIPTSIPPNQVYALKNKQQVIQNCKNITDQCQQFDKLETLKKKLKADCDIIQKQEKKELDFQAVRLHGSDVYFRADPYNQDQLDDLHRNLEKKFATRM